MWPTGSIFPPFIVEKNHITVKRERKKAYVMPIYAVSYENDSFFTFPQTSG